MANSFEYTVADFDLNFLQPSSNNAVSRHDKQRQSILNVKKKIVASNALLQKFYLQKDKLEETESLLLASKEECRQACIDYKVTHEKYTELEKDSVKLKDINRELEKNATHLDNQVEGMKSHAYQLQLLVKEHESVISALKLEKQLQRNSIKDYEKKLGSLEKEHETYLRDIRWMRDVILGKKKAKQIQDILNKYKDEKSSGDSGESDNSGDEGLFDGSPIGSPINEEEKSFSSKVLTGGLNEMKKDKITNDHDSDYGNEVVSEDTGRGSSLALSDKFMNSPDTDYFAGDLNIIIKEPVIQVDVGTSPMRFEENLISSPNIFDDEALLSENNGDDNGAKTPEYFISDIPFSTEIVTIKQKLQLVDASTSPIRQVTDMVHEATSPINFDEPTEIVDEISEQSICALQKEHPVESKTNKKDNAICHTSLNTLSSGCEVEISKKSHEMICLEGNHKQQLNDEINNDFEVEMILSKMRLQHKLISPLPSSPKVKSRQIAVSEIQISNNSDHHNSCPDALKIREENKALQANVAFLCKEVMLIKSLLANNIPNSENIKTISKDTNIFIECSRDTIPIRNDDDQSNEIMTVCDDSNSAFDTMSITTEVENDPIYLEPTEKSTGKTQRMTNNPNFGVQDDENSEITIENVSVEGVDCHNSELRKENEIESINNISETIQNESSNNCSEKGISDGLRFFRNDLSVNNFSARSKRRKPTKLDRFKKKILPKGKIRTLSSPSSRKLKRTPLVPIIKKDIRNKPLEILKNKDAYDKALKVMAELKTKRKTDIKVLRKRIIKRSEKQTDIRNISRSKHHISIFKKGSTNNDRCRKDKICQNPVVVLSSCDITNENNVAVAPKNDSVNNNVVIIESEKDTSIPAILSTEQSSTIIPLTKDITSPKISCDNLLNREKTDLKLNNVNKTVPDSEDLEADNLAIRNGGVQDVNTPRTFVSVDKCDITASDNRQKTSTSTRRRKRLDSDSVNVSCKRLLRSSNVEKNITKEKPVEDLRESMVINYNDLDLFNSDTKKVVEKENVNSETSIGKLGKDKIMNSEENKEHTDSDTSLSSRDIKRRRTNRLSSNNSENSNRRLLRSSNLLGAKNDSDTEKVAPLDRLNNVQIHDERLVNRKSESNLKDSPSNEILNSHHVSAIENTNPASTSINNKSNSILCKMIAKYGKTVVRTSATKVGDKIRNSICEKIDKSLSDIVELPPDRTQTALNELVEEIRKLNKKHFLSAFMKYLQDPARKLELYNKVNTQVAMTKKEQMIVYIVKQLIAPDWNIVDDVLRNIEFALFWLNKSPEFDVIESMSHMYAVICRVFNLKCRLKTFLLDAMYCLQYKAVAVIKQCLTTWAHILPLAHMSHAKTPLVTCIVYLLHFYKCAEDKMNRVRDIRWLLNKKYFFTFDNWNQNKILEMFSNAIKTVKDDPAEMYMLRMAIIVFAKRQGAKWCQRNIINNLLLPTIESDNTSERVRIFCIKMLGPLLKPYPGDMKVHCEIIVNQLLDMLDTEISHKVKEAVFTSLVYMSKQNPPRVTAALLRWAPPAVSRDLETLLQAYVQEKPLKTWKYILSRINC